MSCFYVYYFNRPRTENPFLYDADIINGIITEAAISKDMRVRLNDF